MVMFDCHFIRSLKTGFSETSKQTHYGWFNQMWARTAGFAIEWKDKSSNGKYFSTISGCVLCAAALSL